MNTTTKAPIATLPAGWEAIQAAIASERGRGQAVAAEQRLLKFVAEHRYSHPAFAQQVLESLNTTVLPPLSLAYREAYLADIHAMRNDHAQAAVHAAASMQLRDALAMKSAPARRIIAFSLYGGRAEYCENAVLNAEYLPAVYPGWTMRVYHDHSVPSHVLKRLATQANVELVDASTLQMPGLPGTFWRFFALEDADADAVIVRDVDSLLSERERVLVDEWLASDKPFHVIRDWYSQSDLMLAGMFGARCGLLAGIRGWITQHVKQTPKLHPTHADQHFLAQCVWPRIRDYTLHHSSIGDALGGRWPDALPRLRQGSNPGELDQLGSWQLTQYTVEAGKTCLYRIYEGDTLLAQYQCEPDEPLEVPREYRERFESGRYRLVAMPMTISVHTG